MKFKIFSISVVVIFLISSCLTERKGESAIPDLFEQYEEQKGFVIMNIPSILVKAVLNSASEGNHDGELFNDIEKVKVLIYDQAENSKKAGDVLTGIKKDISDHDFEMVSSINSEGQLISIYVHQKESKAVDEVILLVSGDDDIICMDFIGEIDLKKFMEYAADFQKGNFELDFE